MTLFRRVLLGLAILWIAVLVQRAPLAPDEVEFFRATHWVGEGQTPYRDFWEHHMPLQWLLFAPFAQDWPGVEAIVLMRWVQVAMWIAIFALLVRRTNLSALLLLLTSATFVHRAIEYRVDVPGNLAFVAALALVASRRWVAFGALMSLAVLANMRLAPLVIVTSLLALFWNEERWRFNARALRMFIGAGAVAAIFIAWLFATRTWTPFVDSIIHYNVTSARLLEVDTFFDALLAPLRGSDLGGVAYWLTGLAGVVVALRARRMQFLAVIAIASIVTVALMEVQYDYHFQTTWLLLLPFAAIAIDAFGERWQPVIVSTAGASLLVSLLLVAPTLGDELRYQDTIMTAADRLTNEHETVLDGAGLALRRKPAYRYWFLTTGVRMMAAKRLIDPYDLRDVASAPPAAVILDYRLRVYLDAFPDVGRYLATHYIPLYRNLWIPGMTARLERPSRIVWIAPRAGQYDVWSSAALIKHPWLTNPLRYPDLQFASRYAIPLRRLEPLPDDALQWSVDGVAQPPGTRTLTLRKGSRVELIATRARHAGVLLVPHGIDVIGLAPADDVVF